MGNRQKVFLNFLMAAAVLLCLPAPVLAGGAFSTTPDGDEVLWEGTVTWRAETGPLKGDEGGGGGGGGGCALQKSLTIGNAQAIQMVQNAFNQWGAVSGSQIDIEQGPSLGTDVTFDNIEDFWVGTFFGGTPFETPSNVSAAGCYDNDANTECLNSVIFDSTFDPLASITDAIAGQCARFSMLAFAAILPQQDNDPPQFTISDATLRSSQMVINSSCLPPTIAPDPACGGGCVVAVSEQEMQGTITHEVGHWLGLDHTLVNKEEYVKCRVDNPGGCSQEELEDIPTMIGLFVPGANLHTLHADDIGTFRGFYPAGDGNFCNLNGLAQDDLGGNGRCFEVVARKQDDPRSQAVGAVAGAYVPRKSQGIACTGTQQQCEADPEVFKVKNNCDLSSNQCGQYTIYGLEPGTYNIGIHAFQPNGQSVGSNPYDFVIEPCTGVRRTSNLDNDNFPDANNSGATAVCNPGGGVVNINPVGNSVIQMN